MGADQFKLGAWLCWGGVLAASLLGAARPADVPSKGSTDRIIAEYIRAVGGESNVNRIQTRELHFQRRRGPKVVYYWQAPNKVLLVQGKQKIGFDGGSGWQLSSKKRVTKLSKGAQVVLLTDADPLRFVHMKQLYPGVRSAAPETLDGRKVDVLEAENDRGKSRFYFDQATHLLVHMEESGETSAYFKYTTDFEKYGDLDGVKLPFVIRHDSNEPDAKATELRLSKVMQNVPLQAGIFSRPTASAVVLGGKR